MEDGETSDKRYKKQRKKDNFLQRYITNVSDVLSAIRVRHIVQISNGHDWFVLGSRYNFLLYFRVFLVMLYITYQILH